MGNDDIEARHRRKPLLFSLSPGRKRKEAEGKGKFDFRKKVKEKEGGRVDGFSPGVPERQTTTVRTIKM